MGVNDLATGGHFLGDDPTERAAGQGAVGQDAQRVIATAEHAAEGSGRDVAHAEIAGHVAVAHHHEADVDPPGAQRARERPDEPAGLAGTGDRAQCQQEDLH
jgi:hypothetical protein